MKAKAAADLGYSPTRHGNVGTTNCCFKSNDPVTIALHAHFCKLMESAEVCATCFVKNEVDGTVTFTTLTTRFTGL